MNETKTFSLSTADIKASLDGFAINFFQNQEIAEVRLSLCDKYQLNANMLMFCCWLARESYQRLTNQQVSMILSRTQRWCEKVLQPLTRLSYRLSPFQHARRFSKLFYWVQEGVNNAVQVERSLLLEIATHLEKQTDLNISNMDFALGNIFRYLENLKISLHKNDLEKIYRITSQVM